MTSWPSTGSVTTSKDVARVSAAMWSAWVRAHAADRRGTPWRVDAVAVLVPRTGGIRFDLLQDVRP